MMLRCSGKRMGLGVVRTETTYSEHGVKVIQLRVITRAP